MTNEIATRETGPEAGTINVFGSASGFEAAQRMAKALAASNMVPQPYQGNIANCLVALELSSRLQASVYMIMQHLHVISGRPSFSASFQIATVNASGRFTPLRFQAVGKPGASDYGLFAVATDKASGEVLEGDTITTAMVTAEGWASKPGSKWRTMPGQMFRYRAAAFWARVYAPELLMGLATADEVEDIVVTPVAPPPSRSPAPPAPTALSAPVSPAVPRSGMAGLGAALAEVEADAEADAEEAL